MGRLVVPNLQGKQMGQVTSPSPTGSIRFTSGFIPAEEACTLDNVLVDTVQPCCVYLLPISQLGLVQGRSQCRNNSWD